MISVRAEGLGKAYRMYKRPIDSLKELFVRKDYAETFWALRDVTLEVASGGSLGIIGDNGAGKSTLLKLLAGAAAPTVGSVERMGRISAILTLGAGFHPDLSGSENIRIGCSVLGLSPAQTEAALPEIVDFSELGPFVERPVRTYSSGMYLRLGFSVATAVNPDVLVVDEHLSVGDQHFRFKCMRRIMALRAAGCALIFCSHDLHAVNEVCDRTLWLRSGQPAMLGATQAVVDAYQDHVRSKDAKTNDPIQQKAQVPGTRDRPSENFLSLVRLEGGDGSSVVETGSPLRLQIRARLSEAVREEGAYVGILIIRNDAVWCYGVTMKWDSPESRLHPMQGDEFGVVFVVDDLPLLSGEYSVTAALIDNNGPHIYDTWPSAAKFTVRHSGKDVGVMRIVHHWEAP